MFRIGVSKSCFMNEYQHRGKQLRSNGHLDINIGLLRRKQRHVTLSSLVLTLVKEMIFSNAYISF